MRAWSHPGNGAVQWGGQERPIGSGRRIPPSTATALLADSRIVIHNSTDKHSGHSRWLGVTVGLNPRQLVVRPPVAKPTPRWLPTVEIRLQSGLVKAWTI